MVSWASNILIVETGYAGIHHSKYLMPIHYDTFIEDEQNKKSHLLFSKSNLNNTLVLLLGTVVVYNSGGMEGVIFFVYPRGVITFLVSTKGEGVSCVFVRSFDSNYRLPYSRNIEQSPTRETV